MFSDVYKWYKDNIVIKRNKRYLGKNDSEIFLSDVVEDDNERLDNYCIIVNGNCYISLDYVCDYIRKNNITYDQLHKKICVSSDEPKPNIDDIIGYPWVSFFSKLNKKQVEVINEIAKRDNSSELFKILESLYSEIERNGKVDSKKFLLKHFVKITVGRNKSALFDFGKQCNILFGEKFIFGEKQIDEMIINLDILSRAKTTEIDKYINEKINSFSALLVVLQSINLNPKLKKPNSDELCFDKIDLDFIFNWFNKNNCFSDAKIDDFIKFLEHLKNNYKEYYLGIDIYNSIIEKMRNEYKDAIKMIEITRNSNPEDIKNKYELESSIYKLLVYVSKNEKIDKEKNLHNKKEEVINKFYNDIKDYVIKNGFFSKYDIISKFKIDEYWTDIICNLLLKEKIIDGSGKVITSKKISIDKVPQENDEPKNDNISRVEQKLSNFKEELMEYNRQVKRAMSDQLVIEFLTLKFLNNFSTDEKNNQQFVGMLQKSLEKKYSYSLIELIVNLHLNKSLQGILLNSNNKYKPDEILEWLEYAKKYKIDLGKFEPIILDEYFDRMEYYKKDNLEFLYSFLYQMIFGIDKFEYREIIVNHFIEKYNVIENINKIKHGDYNIEHKIKNKDIYKVDQPNDDNDNDKDDDDKHNSGGMTSSINVEVQNSNTDVAQSQIKKIESLEDDDAPIISMIEKKDDTELMIVNREVSKNADEKKKVFKTIVCGIGVISCAELTAVEEKDILSSVVECAKSFGSLISRDPILQEIKLKLGNNNLVPYFSEIALKFKDALQPSTTKIYVASRG